MHVHAEQALTRADGTVTCRFCSCVVTGDAWEHVSFNCATTSAFDDPAMLITKDLIPEATADKFRIQACGRGQLEPSKVCPMPCPWIMSLCKLDQMVASKLPHLTGRLRTLLAAYWLEMAAVVDILRMSQCGVADGLWRSWSSSSARSWFAG